jgi:preprotein translocase subunit SecD
MKWWIGLVAFGACALPSGCQRKPKPSHTDRAAQLVYHANLAAYAEPELSRVVSRIEDVLSKRATALTDNAIVRRLNPSTFEITLPKCTDIERARRVLGANAKLEWFHAKNLQTARAPWREFDVVTTDGAKPEVWFTGKDRTKTYKPGEPAYALIVKGWDRILGPDDTRQASPIPYQGGFIPFMTFTAEGARKMEEWSRMHSNGREYIAVVLDGVVLNAAPLQEGAIIRGEAQISGRFETKYVKELCEKINLGGLPVPVREKSAEIIVVPNP